MPDPEKVDDSQDDPSKKGVEPGEPLTPREVLEKEYPDDPESDPEPSPEPEPTPDPEPGPSDDPEPNPDDPTPDDPELNLEPLEDDPDPKTPESIPYPAFQERIGKKNAQIEAERARAQKAEEEVQRLRTAPPQAAPSGYQPEAAPKRDDFEDEEAYLDARSAWAGTEAYRKEAAKDEAAATQKAEENRVAEVRQRAEETARDYISKTETILTKAQAENPDKYKDFNAREQVVRSAGLDHMAVQSLVTAEDPVKIVNYLGGKPEVLNRIAKLSPIEQVEEIGHLKKRASMKLKDKKIPKAPPPPTPPQGGGDTQKLKVTDDMSDGEFDRLAASAVETGRSARSMLE